MAKVKIKNGPNGLYVSAGGWYSDRMGMATKFKEGELVMATHHGGSSDATVKSLDGEIEEAWITRSQVASEIERLGKKLSPEEYTKTVLGLFKYGWGSKEHQEATETLDRVNVEYTDEYNLKQFLKDHGGVRKMKPLSPRYKEILYTGDTIKPTFELDFEYIRNNKKYLQSLGFVGLIGPFHWLGASYEVVSIEEKWVKLKRTYEQNDKTSSTYMCGDEVINHITSPRIERILKLESLLK
jgi:hypothetical protein